MKTKQHMRMEIKGISDDGSFTGILSMYNNVDLGRDLVEPGAFTKTIKDRGDEIPLLWQHKPDMPIGSLKLIESDDALHVHGQLLMGVQKAQEAYLLMKAGIVKGLSIGFDTIRETMDKGVRRLKELRLWEGSVVTFPMNQACQILSVKGKASSKGGFEEQLAEQELDLAGPLMIESLQSSLSAISRSEKMTAEEAVAAADASIREFTDAYLAYLPNYLGYASSEYGGAEQFSKALVERKSGRMISASNKKTLKAAHEHMKSATTLIYPLIDVEADDNPGLTLGDGVTSKSKAGTDDKSAPVNSDHSAIESFLDKLKAITA
jgi:HK97 family phage prohead protease